MSAPSRSALRTLFPVTTDSVEATMDVGAALAEALTPGTVVALYGDLGAGKTHFVKGIAAGLGLSPETVRSPTFTLLHVYDDGRLPLYHVDAYRVGDPAELVEMGYEEYVYGDGVCVVEWPARIDALLPDDAVRLRLTHVSPTERRIERVDDEESA